MRCALLGHGYWGCIVERYLRGSKYFSLKYVYTPSQNKGVSLNQILADGQVKVIFVCTPVDTHYQIVKECLMNGKHVFCEKPLTKRYREATELAELAVEKCLCLYTDYIWLDSPSLKYMKQQMESIGDILSVRGEICQFGNFYENDSVVEVLGVHLLSSVLYLLGLNSDPKIVGVEVFREIDGIVIEMEIKMNIAEKIKLTLVCSLVSGVRTRRLCIAGTGGGIEF